MESPGKLNWIHPLHYRSINFHFPTNSRSLIFRCFEGHVGYRGDAGLRRSLHHCEPLHQNGHSGNLRRSNHRGASLLCQARVRSVQVAGWGLGFRHQWIAICLQEQDSRKGDIRIRRVRERGHAPRRDEVDRQRSQYAGWRLRIHGGGEPLDQDSAAQCGVAGEGRGQERARVDGAWYWREALLLRDEGCYAPFSKPLPDESTWWGVCLERVVFYAVCWYWLATALRHATAGSVISSVYVWANVV